MVGAGVFSRITPPWLELAHSPGLRRLGLSWRVPKITPPWFELAYSPGLRHLGLSWHILQDYATLA